MSKFDMVSEWDRRVEAAELAIAQIEDRQAFAAATLALRHLFELIKLLRLDVRKGTFVRE